MADSFALSFFESVQRFTRQEPVPVRHAPITKSPPQTVVCGYDEVLYGYDEMARYTTLEEPQKEIYGYDAAVEYAELQKLPNLFGSRSEAQYRYAFVVRKDMLTIMDGYDKLGLHENIIKHLQNSIDKLKAVSTVSGIFAYHGHFKKAQSQKAKVLKSPICSVTTKLMRDNKDFRCMIQSIIWTEGNDELASLCGLEEWWVAKKKHLATVQNSDKTKKLIFRSYL